ncbi:hypothetical protein [Scytonema sp. NUACC26]|uniref:hypothetical protein n=1 Tax=Scytonema sp. NUACC26 TaxID=3140176 RepID=UPI0034DBC135
MSEKTKVKGYVRKGKIVNSYDRNKKKVAWSTLGGAALGTIATTIGAVKLLSKVSIPSEQKAILGTYGTLTGLVGGTVVGNVIGRKMFLTKEQRDREDKALLNMQKKTIPYQDKDLTGMQGAIDKGVLGGLVGGAGSLGYGVHKLMKKVKTLDPNSKAANRLRKLGFGLYSNNEGKRVVGFLSDVRTMGQFDPEVAGRYGTKMLKRAGKIALVTGVLGAGLGYLQGRQFADKLNKKLGKKDREETGKQRFVKITKGVGAAALGAGIGLGTGYLISKGFVSTKGYKASMEKLRKDVFGQVRHGIHKRTNARLTDAGNKLVDEYRTSIRTRPEIKLLGDGSINIPEINTNDVLREQFKRKGERIGRNIQRRTANSHRVLNNVEDYLNDVNHKMSTHNALGYGSTGAVLGLGLYKTSYRKSKQNKSK